MYEHNGRPTFSYLATAASVAWAGVLSLAVGTAQAAPTNPWEKGYRERQALIQLGKRVFFDKISRPKREQACASCHDPSAGWTGPDSRINATVVAMPGAAFHPRRNPDAIGTLKPPTNAYASGSPIFSDRPTDCPFGAPPNAINFCGGNFWNGRATGRGALDEYSSYEGFEVPLLYPRTGDTSITQATQGAITRKDVFVSTRTGDWDSRREIWFRDYLGPVAEQALNPFPNPVEQNIQVRQVCRHVKKAAYADLYEVAWGEPLLCDDNLAKGHTQDGNPAANTTTNYWIGYKRIAVALSAYQHSDEVNQFSSKRDDALRRELSGRDRDATPGEFPLKGLTAQENWGHDLFYAGKRPPVTNPPIPAGTGTVCEPKAQGGTKTAKGANCSFCHSDNPAPLSAGGDDGAETYQLYSDDHYHNIGVPRNPEIPVGNDFKAGLAGHTGLDNSTSGERNQIGLFKTPTARNVDARPYSYFVKGYTHNGWFKSLRTLVHFYNTADVNGATAAAFGIKRCADANGKPIPMTERQALDGRNNCWPEPEHSGSAIPFLVGDLGLSECDEAAIVSYLKTLSDTKKVGKPGIYRPILTGN